MKISPIWEGLLAAFKLLTLFSVLSLTACTYDSASLSQLSCDEEGQRDRDRLCREGLWVSADLTELGPDADMGCTPQQDQTICERLGAQCGLVRAVDNCGAVRAQVQCGGCPNGAECDASSKCACIAESDELLCARASKDCGQITITDRCGQERKPSCGSCDLPQRCGEDNVCACTPETDRIFCERQGKNCGQVTNMDSCNQERAISCGTCAQGECKADNTCTVCVPESDEGFCARLGKNCGMVEGMDNCGMPRTAQSCGGCDAGQRCDTNNQCECPVPSCQGAQCGMVTNACGNTRTCGVSCTADQICTNNQCICPEVVCPQGAQCGTVTNDCGSTKNCGSCASRPNTRCEQHLCVCTPEDDATFCARQGKNCGSFSGMDNCNAPRNNVNCGICSDNGARCQDNICAACVGESDATFCSRQGKTCGSFSGMDNCGMPRMKDCGMCSAPTTCQNNTCVCTPEDDATFCSRQGKTCGSFSGMDNCNARRNNVSCGMCTAPTSCQPDNTCKCIAETDAAFCARLNTNCGEVKAEDNCGAMRTVNSCGVCANGQCKMDNTCP